jgi:hypothetical protein
LWNSLKDLSTEDFEQCLEDCEWQAIKQKLSLSRQREKERRTSATGSSLLPTPTTYARGSGKHRPAGSNKLEQHLKPFLGEGDKLNPAAVGWMMGYPPGWVEGILMDGGLSIQLPFIPEYATTPTAAAPAAISTASPSPPNKQRSPSNEFSTCPGCASQTIQLEQGCGVCGWQRDLLLGDKPDSTPLSPSKISQQRSHPAREVSPSKTRRRKGEGSGSIHPKPIVRNGKTYHQHWYHYEIWEGGDRLVKRTRYIPQHLLSRVQRLDGEKAPVREILKLLGVIR